MADTKISALPASTTPLAGTEVLPIVQSGVTKKTSIESVLTSVQPSGTANGVAYLNGSKVLTTGSALVFDGSNLGLGVTPSAWVDYKAIQLGGGAIASYTGNAYFELFQNAVWDGAFKYVNNGFASKYEQNSSAHRWYTAPSGTAGNAIGFTQAMTLDASGNWALGATSVPANRRFIVEASGDTVGRINSGSATSGLSIEFANNGTIRGGIGNGSGNITSGSASDMAVQAVNNLVFASGGYAERARIDSSGNLLIGTTTNGGQQGLTINPNGSAGSAFLIWNRADTASASTAASFRNNGTAVGRIEYTNTATSYVTSSDYRLKNTIAPMTGALAKVALLKPCTYKWNADGSDGEGFIAHELAEVVPQCVTGEKDAVDAEGKPQYQGIDTSFLVATVVAALQELKAEFDAYKASHP
jgi:hypothetical protein